MTNYPNIRKKWSKKANAPRWYIAKKYQGKYYYSPIGEGRAGYETLAQAKKALRLLEQELQDGQEKLTERSLQQFINEYYTKRIRADSPRGYRTVISMLNNHLFDHIKPDTKLKNIKSIDLMEIKKALEGSCKKSYAYIVIAQIIKLFRIAQEEGYIDKNPAVNIKSKRVKPSFRPYIDIELIMSTIKSLPLEYQTFAALAFYAALRRNEIAALEWKHIDFEHGRIAIEQQYDPRSPTRITPTLKTESSHNYIKMLSVLARILKEWKLLCPSNRFVFPSNLHKDRPAATKRFFNIIHNVFKRRGIDITIKDLRSLSTELYYETGIPFKIASRQLRHASIETTHLYYDRYDEEKELDRISNGIDEFLKNPSQVRKRKEKSS